jgi:1-acyl-sn-glycerol-3-phosphate acyltransferase
VGGLAVSPLALLKLGLIGLDTVLMAPVIVGVALFDQKVAYHICQWWVWLNLRICGVRVRVRRLAPLDPEAPYVFMSNHRSQYDILAVVAALREFQLRWVAKKELTRVPVFGWALKHTGHVIIDRSDHQQAVESLRAARAQMLDGISVTIFPEGTRSAPGQRLLPFKKGGFMLALETGFPIVPIVVRGSGEILPRGSWQPAPGELEVVVGAPIAVEGVARDALMQRVQEFMLTQLGASALAARAG